MKHIILGTAGHVDHGKTSLIKVLTGVDTDRLKEEKQRGITIELGFASLTLSNGRVLGVVDVPGHERFIRNMVAGAGGIDLVVLVIAADEGVMPQTREHLHICSLLGIKRGIVVLTKTDLVDASWLELVTDDVGEFLKGTFLESVPIVSLSALTGAGLPEFLRALEGIVSKIEEDTDNGIFRLPVDRVFTMRGFGTVVTGTLLSGMLQVGEEVVILPHGLTAKVRGIQVHNSPTDQAETGQRTAVNLQGVEKAMILRGNVLAHPGTLEPSRRLDVIFEHLPGVGKKLKNRALVRFHAGTSEIIARVSLVDRDELEPGDKAYAQLFLQDPTAVMARDRFVIRSYSPMTTIGGGMILDPMAKKHKRQMDRTDDFRTLQEGTDGERTAVIVKRSGLEGITLSQLVVRTGIHMKGLNKILEEMFSRKLAMLLDREETRVVDVSVYHYLQGRILAETKTYHERFPLKEGLHKEELRTMLGRFVGVKLFNMVMKDLEKSGRMVISRENVRLDGHSVELKGELEGLRTTIAKIYLDSGLTPPLKKEALAKFTEGKSAAESVLRVMLNEGSLIKVSEDLIFHAEVIDRLRNEYKNALIRDGKATPATFKELTGLSRKYIIPLMEYFDAVKLTIRAGEHRILRDREAG